MRTADLNLKLFGCCLTAAMIAQPALAADARNGEQLARRWCEPCHVVADDQREVTGEAPPFASISRRPGFDASRIAMFLLDPHPKMPDMSLTRIEAADLAAYIATLARQQGK
jgi:mono/diheme cytochrome c family protein